MDESECKIDGVGAGKNVVLIRSGVDTTTKVIQDKPGGTTDLSAAKEVSTTYKTINVRPNTEILIIQSGFNDSQRIMLMKDNKHLNELNYGDLKVKFTNTNGHGNNISVDKEVKLTKVSDIITRVKPDSHHVHTDYLSHTFNSKSVPVSALMHKNVIPVPQPIVTAIVNNPAQNAPIITDMIKTIVNTTEVSARESISDTNVNDPDQNANTTTMDPLSGIPESRRQALINLVVSKYVDLKRAAECVNISYEAAQQIFSTNSNLHHFLPVKSPAVGKLKRLTDHEVYVIRQKMTEDCTMSLSQLKSFVFKEFGKTIGVNQLSLLIDFFRYTVKRLSPPVVDTGLTDDSTEQRKYYAIEYMKLIKENRRIYFLDYATFNVLSRPHVANEKVTLSMMTKVPMLRSRNVTVVAVMSEKGLFYDVYRRTVGEEIVEQHLERVFTELKAKQEDKCVFIMDYLKFRDYYSVGDLFTKYGHEMRYLPVCSQRLNPLEQVFSRWHHLVRQQRPANEREIFAGMNNIKNLINGGQCDAFVAVAKYECQNYGPRTETANNDTCT